MARILIPITCLPIVTIGISNFLLFLLSQNSNENFDRVFFIIGGMIFAFIFYECTYIAYLSKRQKPHKQPGA
jgi:formate hydrogenlyase subunit 3/multisubunit Na+/H+ antiporter MnhD subunit